MADKSKPIRIHVNGEIISVKNQRISYEKVLKLSGSKSSRKKKSVIFFDADSKPHTGFLSKGHDVIASRVIPTRFQVVYT